MIKLAFFFLILIGCILTHSQLSFQYAALGLNLWFEKMIPVLFPFMTLSGIMVRLGLTEKIAVFIKPLLKPVFRVNGNVCYAIFMGFLCGFPMGAKVIAELYNNQRITNREARFLLAFCNNIGPIYFCSFVLPLLQRSLILPYLFGMYGIPFLYGIVLRYTQFRDLEGLILKGDTNTAFSPPNHTTISLSKRNSLVILDAIDDSINTSIQSILALGGYMVLFNLLNILPRLTIGEKYMLFSPLLEISGGLMILEHRLPLYSLLVLSFGGLSCLAQTYHCIRETDLSIANYILHKIILTLLCALYYLVWFLLFPHNFLL